MTPTLLGIASIILFFLSLIFFSVLRSYRVNCHRKSHKVSNETNSNTLRIAIYFVTQTGTAERFAREVESEIKQRYGDTVCVRTADMAHVKSDLSLINKDHEPLVIFLQYTYGDGEPTDSSADFVHWLHDLSKGTSSPTLDDLTFTVFGLGNSSYEHFNAAAKLVDSSMQELGATRLMSIHLGDDYCCLEEDYQSWKELLWSSMETRYDLCSAVDFNIEDIAFSYDVIPSTTEVAWAAESADVVAFSKRPSNGPPSQSVPSAASISHARELHSIESERSCIHVEFDLRETGICYEHGDHLGVFPENSLPVVQRAAACLQLPLDFAFVLNDTIRPESSTLLPPPFRTPCTLSTALTKYADLLTPPRKSALTLLAFISTDKGEKLQLERLASQSGRQEYAAFITDPRRTLLEVLEAFPSAVPSLGLFFGSICPRLTPRFYSISSSPRFNSDLLTITVAVVRGETPTGRLHEGVASTYLQRFVPKCTAGEKEQVCVSMRKRRVPLFVRRSLFKLPQKTSSPVVMIGPGTGFAPFRGFLQERAALAENGKVLGRALVFFGCRHESHDFIYRDEMENALSIGTISELHTAFSRDVPDRKTYVQDRLMIASVKLYGIMKGLDGAGGTIYVCGDAKGMARDVHRSLLAILMTEGGYAGYEADDIMKQLSESGRYQKDVW